MALSQEVLKTLIVALADKEAGKELFNAINNGGGVSLSNQTLRILIVALADRKAALELARTIRDNVIMPDKVLKILTVACCNADISTQINEKITENATIAPPSYTVEDFLIDCETCLSDSGDNTELANCYSFVETKAIDAGSTGSCTATSGYDWSCGCSASLGGSCLPTCE